MANATLRRVVTEQALDSEAIMKNLVKESGILMTAEAQASTHGHFHKYKRVSALPTFSVYAAGGSLTDQTVDDEVYQLDLKNIGAIQSEPKEVAETFPGGPGPFFEKQMPAFIEGWGQQASKSVIYGTSATLGDTNSFKGFFQYVHQTVRTDGMNSNVNYIRETGTSASTTSIFAVTWDAKTCALLYDEQATRNQGQFLEVLELNEGQPVTEVTNTTTGAKKVVYQVLYTARIALWTASFKDIAAYTRIQDDTNDRPTAANMDLLLDLVRADSTRTVLYMNRTSRRLLGTLKDSKLQTFVGDKEYNTIVEAWNGIPIQLDENILDTETTAAEAD